MYYLEPVAKEISKMKNYTFVEPKGKGTFKETFRVKNTSGLDEALKVFKEGRSSRDRLDREIEAMQRCSHPNVVRLIELSRFDFKGKGYTYMIEEYLPGGTLTEELKKGPAGYDYTHDLGTILIDAIGHIASHDLVHRDIKPDNILFREDKATPVIVDFGVVRDLSDYSLTPTWAMAGPGTPYFAAPEQLNNEKDLIDWRTDQFSLGVVLSICLLGMHPYAHFHDSSDDIVNRVARRDPPESSVCKEIKEKGLLPIAIMISPWPADRYRTPEHLSRAWRERTSGGEK